MPGPHAIDPAKPFRDLGFDSLTAVELRNQLSTATGLQLPATVIFNYPTPEALATYLRARTIGQEQDYMPVLKELDRLESALSAVASGDDARAKITARLEAIANDFRANTVNRASVDQEVAAATDDEMFDLIDKELGIFRADKQ
jgi:polyketide synthase 12